MDQASTECTRKKSCIQPPTTMPIGVRVALWEGILWKQLFFFFLFGCKSPKPLKRHMVLMLWLICVHAFTEGVIRVFIVISIHSCYGKVLFDSVCFSSNNKISVSGKEGFFFFWNVIHMRGPHVQFWCWWVELFPQLCFPTDLAKCHQQCRYWMPNVDVNIKLQADVKLWIVANFFSFKDFL